VRTALAILVLTIVVFAARFLGVSDRGRELGSDAGISSGLGGVVTDLPAGTVGQVVASLEDAGHEVIVANPRKGDRQFIAPSRTGSGP
jgi:hypothetical protein